MGWGEFCCRRHNGCAPRATAPPPTHPPPPPAPHLCRRRACPARRARPLPPLAQPAPQPQRTFTKLAPLGQGAQMGQFAKLCCPVPPTCGSCAADADSMQRRKRRMSAEVRARHPVTASSSAARRPAAGVEGPGKQAGPVWALRVGQRAGRGAAGRRPRSCPGRTCLRLMRGLIRVGLAVRGAATGCGGPQHRLQVAQGGRRRRVMHQEGAPRCGQALATRTPRHLPVPAAGSRAAAGCQQGAAWVAGAGMRGGAETLGGRAKPRSGGVCMLQRSPLQRQPARRLAGADVGLAEDAGARRQVHRRLQGGGGTAAGGVVGAK
jgi:hypothetical protein